MKKIVIPHNSLYGNSKKLAIDIAEGLNDKFDVTIGRITEINPKDVSDNLYGLIIASRIEGFGADAKMRKFITEVNSYRKEPIPKTAVCYTHLLKLKKFFKKSMDKTLRKATNIVNIYQEFL